MALPPASQVFNTTTLLSNAGAGLSIPYEDRWLLGIISMLHLTAGICIASSLTGLYKNQ